MDPYANDRGIGGGPFFRKVAREGADHKDDHHAPAHACQRPACRGKNASRWKIASPDVFRRLTVDANLLQIWHRRGIFAMDDGSACRSKSRLDASIRNLNATNSQATGLDLDQARLTDILERLQRHRQAATYGAIAGVLGVNPRRLMAKQHMSFRNSWAVSKTTRRPT